VSVAVKRAVVIAITGALVLAGCGNPSIPELAQMRDECNQAGGVFHQWRGGLGTEQFRCDFDQEGAAS